MTTFPGVIPVTTPELFTVAIALSALDHVPPAVTSESVVVAPGQTVNVPVIAATVGLGFMVKDAALVPVPAGVVTLIVPVVAPAGSVALICILLFTIKVAAVPLKVTAVAPLKLVPVIVIVGLVPLQALLGENPVTVVTAGRSAIKMAPFLSAPDKVAVPFPVAPIAALMAHAPPTDALPEFWLSNNSVKPPGLVVFHPDQVGELFPAIPNITIAVLAVRVVFVVAVTAAVDPLTLMAPLATSNGVVLSTPEKATMVPTVPVDCPSKVKVYEAGSVAPAIRYMTIPLRSVVPPRSTPEINVQPVAVGFDKVFEPRWPIVTSMMSPETTPAGLLMVSDVPLVCAVAVPLNPMAADASGETANRNKTGKISVNRNFTEDNRFGNDMELM